MPRALSVSFETVLYRDGDIRFNYGQTNAGLTPTVGISAGDGVNYTMSTRDGAGTISAYESSHFHYGGLLPAGLSWDPSAGRISGTPTEEGLFEFSFRVDDSGWPRQSDTDSFLAARIRPVAHHDLATR